MAPEKEDLTPSSQQEGESEFSKEGIRKLIAEEILRPEVQKAITPKREKQAKLLSVFFRHPIFLAILGFALTSIVGTLISQVVADRSQRDAELVDAFDAVQSFASEAAELRVRQDFLISALDRKVTENAIWNLKADYDQSYLSWNTSRYQNYLAIRSFFGFTYDNFAEQAISRTIHQDFRAFNECLEELFEGFGNVTDIVDNDRRDSARPQLNNCLNSTGRFGRNTKSDGYIDAVEYRSDKIFQCSRRIFDVLHHFIAKDINCSSSIWRPAAENKSAQVEILYNQFWDECGVGESLPYNRHVDGFEAFCTFNQPSGPLNWLR